MMESLGAAGRVSHALLLWMLLAVALVTVLGLVAWMAARRAARRRAERESRARERSARATKVDAWSESGARLRPDEPPSGRTNAPDL